MKAKMSRLVISGLAIAMVLALGGSEAWAQRGGWGRGGGHGGGWMRQVKSLDLSTKQVQSIAEARADMIAKVAPVRAQIVVKRHELHALWSAKTPNRRAIIAKHNEINALDQGIRNARIDFKIRVFGVLTAHQRVRLQKAIEAGPPGRGRGPGKRPGRGHRGGGWGGGPGAGQ